MNTKLIATGLGGVASISTFSDNVGKVVNKILAHTMTHFDLKFIEYVYQHGRSYATPEEFKFRAGVFKQRDSEIQAFNLESKNTHVVGHNQFSDRTYDEMKIMNGYKHQEAKRVVELVEDDLPDSVDWRSKGAVTPVKDQGQCGSCWAFSTTGSVEAAYFIKYGVLKSFSEQQLVDCANGPWHNNGCMGGLMDNAFQYIEKYPLEEESAYPYKASESSCQAAKSKEEAHISGFTDVPKGSALQLRAALNKVAVSVAIEADQMAFQNYQSGVITTGCGTQLDHGVLAVGYGTLGGQEYFLVKNSWGSTWGDHGYVRIGANNVCGILEAASYPHE